MKELLKIFSNFRQTIKNCFFIMNTIITNPELINKMPAMPQPPRVKEARQAALLAAREAQPPVVIPPYLARELFPRPVNRRLVFPYQ